MRPEELLSGRVERLEKTVEGLQTLPAAVAALGERVGAVETQILQLHTEMRVEFSDVRGEMRTEFAAVRSEMQVGFTKAERDTAKLREETQAGFARAERETAKLREETQEGFAAARDDMLVGLAELGRQIHETAEEGKRHSRVLFEEALGRIATLGERRGESPGHEP
jgi:Skp family chaperone for outer membrane proteins